MTKIWLLIVVASIIEVGWVIGLKHAGTTLEWIATFIAILISFGVVIYSSSQLPVGTVYAVFVGLGAAGTVFAEMLLFNEPVVALKLMLIGILLAGVLGLKLLTKEAEA